VKNVTLDIIKTYSHVSHAPPVVHNVYRLKHVQNAVLRILKMLMDAQNVRRHVKRVHPNIIALHVMMDLN
jgi:hypothetical protein